MDNTGVVAFRRVARILMVVFSLGMLLFHEYTTATLPLPTFMQTSIHLGLAMCIICFSTIAQNRSSKVSPRDIIILAVILMNLMFNTRILLTKGYIPSALTINLSTMDTTLAIIAIASILFIVSQVIGMSMAIVSGAFIAYCFLGPYLQGILKHSGLTLNRVLSATYLTVEGIYGTPLQISASDVFPLMAYGGIMISLGGGELLMGLAQKTFGTFSGGIAKVAVISSALFGMLSGAGPANAATTGSFTIPMMKEKGYDATFAAAVEAAASIGGQVMPPIMGAAAFIMATNLDVNYGYLILCAAPAAIFYYMAIYVAVDIEAQKKNLVGMSRLDIPPLWPLVREYWHILISVAVLVFMLVALGFGPGSSAFWGTMVLIISETISTLIRKKKHNYKVLLDNIVDTVHNSSTIAVSCACAGIILCAMDKTGLAIKMTSLLLFISGGKVIYMLIMSAISSLIMGMALPTVACYIIVATMVAPSLINAGVDPFSAHFFAFYFGIISNITPPVALTAFVAAGIAKTSPMKTAVQATRIGIAGFILPFLFVWDPGILLQGTGGNIAISGLRAIFIVFTIALALGGYWFNMRLPVWMRMLLGGAALLIFIPFNQLNVLSYVFIIICLALHYYRSRINNKV